MRLLSKQSLDGILSDTKNLEVAVEKVSDELGIVFGFAMVCKINGEDYYDLHGDHITEKGMLEATAEFMSGDRIAKDLHRGSSVGQVLFGFPLTTEIAKSMGITSERHGYMVGMKPFDDAILAKYRSGEYKDFSMGGSRIEDEVVEE